MTTTLPLTGYFLIAVGVLFPTIANLVYNWQMRYARRKHRWLTYKGVFLYGQRKSDWIAKICTLVGILFLVANVAVSAQAATSDPSAGKGWYMAQVCGEQGNAVECKRLLDLEHERSRESWENTLAKQAGEILEGLGDWVIAVVVAAFSIIWVAPKYFEYLTKKSKDAKEIKLAEIQRR